MLIVGVVLMDGILKNKIKIIYVVNVLKDFGVIMYFIGVIDIKNKEELNNIVFFLDNVIIF